MRPGYSSICILAAFYFCLAAATVSGSVSLSPGLERLISDETLVRQDSVVDVMVFLEDSDGPSRNASFSNDIKRSDRIRRVINRLKSTRVAGAADVYELLNRISETDVQRFWIVPAFSARIPADELARVAAHESVKLVVENARLELIKPVEGRTAPSLSTSVSTQLNLLGVPELWRRGLTGKGRLVCSFDTGVEQTHPALNSKWRGHSSGLSSSWFSTVAPNSPPFDRVGHGTHTMGVMVGSTSSDTIGVAPDADWITAGVIDQGKDLSMTLADIVKAFQWTLDPDGNPNTSSDVPDVILNSWGVPKGLFAPCDNTFNAVISACEAAGIVVIFAAGNEGPGPSTMRNPADLATSPFSTFSVGAVDNSLQVAPFSSRGPSSCNSGEIKPEVVVPGVNIRSSYKGGGYFVMSGSSMAAPYVAGLVALMRQHNPDATVAQIKNALINSTIDIGPPGEDNASGHGFVDASLLPENLLLPVPSEFSIVRKHILGDGIANPGEKFRMNIYLNVIFGQVDRVSGLLSVAESGGTTILSDEADFYFEPGSSLAISDRPYELAFDESLHNGDSVLMTLHLFDSDGSLVDSVEFSLIVGIAPDGNLSTVSTGPVMMTVSDFGQYGLAPGSIYDVAGDGFRLDNGPNLLYEAGLIIGRSEFQLSSSVRSSNGDFVPSDFEPYRFLSSGAYGADGGFHRTAAFKDFRPNGPLEINITQETVTFENQPDDHFVILKYYLNNNSDIIQTDLHFGFLADFDLPGGNERLKYNETLNLIYQVNSSGTVVGLVGLKNITGYQAVVNSLAGDSATKLGFEPADKFDLISSGSRLDDTALTGDMMFVASAGPVTIPAGDSVEVTLALVTANDEISLLEAARAAIRKVDLLTTVDERILAAMPDDIELNQNYPNPFNPSTTITFALKRSGDVVLSVFNMLGQRVKILYDGRLPVGYHRFEWDGTNGSGRRAASGVYFYRLQTDNAVKSKKMMLMK